MRLFARENRARSHAKTRARQEGSRMDLYARAGLRGMREYAVLRGAMGDERAPDLLPGGREAWAWWGTETP